MKVVSSFVLRSVRLGEYDTFMEEVENSFEILIGIN